ncbi:MAG: ABC transporter permease subunit [Alphaproteobacteria bacterium]|nr:ABC transporter permease subunit [Alphaproteobacteria bacterium]
MALTAPATETFARAPSDAAAAPRRRVLRGGAFGLVAAAVCLAPVLGVLVAALTAGDARWDDGMARLVRDSALGLAGLLLVGGGGATLIGVATAWLVTVCEFPGRRQFEWALVAPLVLPAYVMAYAYGGLSGPFGLIPFEITGFWGAAFVYAFAFFPYVYLAARAGFASQSVCALEAARALGATPWETFATVAAPLARPAIAAGAALALMEIAADYGAAAYFGAETMTTGVFHAWFARGDKALALQLAAALLLAAFVFLALERHARSLGGVAGGSARWRPLPRYALPPGAGLAATAVCAVVLVLGALLPFGYLAWLASLRPASDWAALAAPLTRSVLLAAGGAIVTLALAFAIARLARASKTIGRYAALAAGAGYAAPGAVAALGALAVFAALRDAGLIGGLTGAVAIAALIWTYAARFASAGIGPVDAGLARITPSIHGAARTLGASAETRLWRIEAPLAAPSLAAAALILFVEILRELPATLILRPFDFDTLAIRAHVYASDDRLAQAAAPALLIALASVGPVIALSRRIAAGRPGAAAEARSDGA